MQMSSETNFCKVLGLTVDITNSFLNNTFIGRTVPEGWLRCVFDVESLLDN